MARTLRSQRRRPWFDAWSRNSVPHVTTSLYGTTKNILSAATRTEDPTCSDEDPAQPNKYINIKKKKKKILTLLSPAFPLSLSQVLPSPANLLSSDPHCLLPGEANLRQATTLDFLLERY